MERHIEISPGYYIKDETDEERIAGYNITEKQVDELLTRIPNPFTRDLIKERYLKSLRPSIPQRIRSFLSSLVTHPK
jgi:hypothetical protein